MGIFGKLSVVHFEESEVTLSMIRWGFLRRYRAARGRITFFDTGALFIPKYEIAVFDRPTSIVSTKPPAVVLYNPDKASALLGFGDLESAIKEGGLFGEPMRDFVSDANPQRQHFWGVSPEFQR